MKSTTVTFLLAFSSFAASGCISMTDKARQADEIEILRLEDQWVEALVHDDAKTLDRIIASDFTFIEPDGRMMDRSAYLDDRGNNANDTSSFTNDELKVRFYGKFAVVSGHAHIRESIDGKPYAYELRWQELWRKRHGRWQVLCGQGTPVNSKWIGPFERGKTGS